MNHFWRYLKSLFVKKPSLMLKMPPPNLDDDAVCAEYRELLSEMEQLLKKYKYEDEAKAVEKALKILSDRNSDEFIRVIGGNDFWGGACSVSDFIFYEHKSGNMEIAKYDTKQMDLLMCKLSRLLLRDGMQNPRIESLGQWHAQRAINVDSY